ncbi:MAG: SagB/ThcOx family dehydrogenase [Candidatus Omnitrophota bacterium]
MKKLSIFVCLLAAFFPLARAAEDSAAGKPEEVRLPRPAASGKISLEETIARRRSQRTFAQRQLTLEQIGQLLWAAQGITDRQGDYRLRSTPSAGALYPMEIYALTADGAYRYLPENHALEVLAPRDLRADLSYAGLGQEPIRRAALDIVICAVYERTTVKYRERGRRYVEMEAGHVAQNVLLQSVALGLGSVSIGAFDDDRVRRLLNLPEDQAPLYIIPVGYPE